MWVFVGESRNKVELEVINLLFYMADREGSKKDNMFPLIVTVEHSQKIVITK